MGSKKIRPVTPGMRGQVATDFKDITKKKPEKSLLESKKSSGGRNNKGRITSRHRGGGHKQKYRVIDFKRIKDGIPARVAGIEYDPNRNARIALLHYIDGEKSYIIAPDGISVDSRVESGPKAVCWSNFKLNFVSRGLGFTFDLKDLVEYHRLYNDLMNFWKKQYGNFIYQLDYEELTNNQEE